MVEVDSVVVVDSVVLVVGGGLVGRDLVDSVVVVVVVDSVVVVVVVVLVLVVVVTVRGGPKGLVAFSQFNPSFEFVSSEGLTKPVGILSVVPSLKICVTFT
mmetsp:Transcript_46711/g.74386  ORF Transcript_46711/g.74386 Transcript_46711/m.74386 type:complete len:101 (-) Transcript_46711:970-1272(-)